MGVPVPAEKNTGAMTWDERVRALSKMRRPALINEWYLRCGQGVVYLAAPVCRWSRDEIIADILRAEFKPFPVPLSPKETR